MTLDELYEYHDQTEKFLRELERDWLRVDMELQRAVWRAHDALERVIIREQSKQTEEALNA